MYEWKKINVKMCENMCVDKWKEENMNHRMYKNECQEKLNECTE